MRIGQMMAGAAHGGAELFFERMSVALQEAGDVVLPVIRPEPQRVARLRAAGLESVGLRFGGPLDLMTRPRAARALRAFGAEVVMAWMSRAAFHAPPGGWRLVGRLGGYYDLKYFRHCDRLVGNTRDIVRWIVEQGWPAAKVSYLPNFVADFAGEAPADRNGLGVPEGAPIILALGRLHTVKGFDVLIRAIASVPRAHLVIAGEGPERGALERLVLECGVPERVHLVGWRNDIGSLLKAARVFVSSSRHEPLGNMVLEAFSASVPVVAATAEGPRALIRDGVDGVLVPTDDADALVGAIGRVLDRPNFAASLGDAGRLRYRAEFAAPVVVAAWQTYFAELIR